MQKRKWLWPSLLFAVSLCFTLFLELRLGIHNLDADQSSEYVLADLLNREHALLSTNWFYSTELRIVSPTPVYQIALALFPSWRLARLFSIAILMIASALSFLFLCSSIDRLYEGLFFTGILVLPFSGAYRFLFAWGGFYTVDFIMCCLILGLTMKIARKQNRTRWIALVMLSIWGGLAGVRIPMLLGIPLVLCCFIMMIKGPRNEYQPYFFTAAVGGLGEFAGYLINKIYLCRIYDFRQYEQIQVGTFSTERLWAYLEAVLRFLGYRDNVPLLSLAGITDFVLVCLFLAMPVFCVVLLKNTQQTSIKVITLFSITATGLIILLLTCLNGFDPLPETCGYCIFGLLLMLFCPLLCFDLKYKAWKTIGLTMLWGLFITDTVCMTKIELSAGITDAERVAAYLCDQGLTKGCATFWNGNLLTELSDGEIEVTTYSTWSSGVPQPWLQEKQHLQEESTNEPVFVYITGYEEMTYHCPCAQKEHLIYENGDARIYKYASMQEVIDLQQGRNAGGRK